MYFTGGLFSNKQLVKKAFQISPPHNKLLKFFSRTSPGGKYWVFKDNNVEEGYPRLVSDFGLPMEGVDAVFVWLHNEKTYFFKDYQYWRYDDHLRRMDLGYPKDTALWKGIPPQLDDAMRWSDSECS